MRPQPARCSASIISSSAIPTMARQPPEDTVAYLGYTHEALFVAFVCRDKTPSLIRAHMLARDAPGDDDDVFVMLDTFHDQRRAFLFQSNPLGIQTDALYSEQTGYDFSFDTVWDTWGTAHAHRLCRAHAHSLRQPLFREGRARPDAHLGHHSRPQRLPSE